MARNHKIDAQVVLARAQKCGPTLYVSRGEAAALLDLLCNTSSEDSYQFRKALATQMDRASGTRTRRARIPPLQRRADGSVRIGELARWATIRFKLSLDELPRDPPRIVSLSARASVAVFTDSAQCSVYPGDVKQCHQIIQALEGENERLRAELESYEPRRIQDLVSRFSK
ncbi:MAG: hypothetical protein KDI66_20380 [Xanthomonadales bacterium]|nr:hypothetical protein [Xanthomonadales bacterium]